MKKTKNMQTTFRCKKCNMENVVDLFVDNILNALVAGRDMLIYDYKCKDCRQNHSLTIDLFWKKDKLIKWDIKTVRELREPIKWNTTDNIKKIKNDNLIDTPQININKKEETDNNLSIERILSAIWMGLTKLNVPENKRQEIMKNIEKEIDV